MTTWNKLWVSIIGVVLLGLAEFLPDNDLSVTDWIKLASMVAGTVLVARLANTTINQYAKGLCQAVAGSAPVALMQLADGWQTNQDLWVILVAAATAVGVIQIPNSDYAPEQRVARAA